MNTFDSASPISDFNPVFVSVKMHDGERFRGYIHVPEGERLQDIMNDERRFFRFV
jgi:hypothetical protein